VSPLEAPLRPHALYLLNGAPEHFPNQLRRGARPSGHGATAGGSVAGQHPLFPPGIDPEPFDLKPTRQIRTYPFGVILLKSP